MADLLQLPKPNKERGIRRMRGCVRLPLSPFFPFWMQMVSETSAFDWHAVCCVFILILERFARGLSCRQISRSPCVFVWARMVVFMLCALCVFVLFMNLCPVQQTEMCEAYNVCSYLILFPWPFALCVWMCVYETFWSVCFCLCVSEITEPVYLSTITAPFVSLPEPFSRPSTLLLAGARVRQR